MQDAATMLRNLLAVFIIVISNTPSIISADFTLFHSAF
tara:strand:- start:8376 stop:8489 length:114 start_codon:yes stop_codon:yes gene_type:complete